MNVSTRDPERSLVRWAIGWMDRWMDLKVLRSKDRPSIYACAWVVRKSARGNEIDFEPMINSIHRLGLFSDSAIHHENSQSSQRFSYSILVDGILSTLN